MCGVAGMVGCQLEMSVLRTRVQQMQRQLRHRGPDDDGIHVDSSAAVGLAHARLAILDLSDSGHQPMFSPDGRYVVVFNGEIYNFKQLRRELEQSGEAFASQSDTEVLLRMYQRRGPQFVDCLEGMFAIAIWDSRDRSCFLARDPFGIKPLYIWRRDGAIAFASEVRSLLHAKLGPTRLCGEALRDYLLQGSVQEPLTLVEGIVALEPGAWLRWRDGVEESDTFWRPSFDADHDAIHDRDPSVAIEITRKALRESIQKHFVSDVPVGIFLSGGIDSTAILALANLEGFQHLRTFCLSFDEVEFNEGELARRTATHFATDHHDWRITAQQGSELIHHYLAALDQPSNDGFNTFCVSKFAREMGAKVVLSGLGGDELFGGYPSFRRVPQLHRWHRQLAMIPGARGVAAAAARRFIGGNRGPRLAEYFRGDGSIDSAHRCMRGIFTRHDTEQLLKRYLSHLPPPDSVVGGESAAHRPHDQVSLLELTTYMRNQLLRDSDVMSMAWGLELRVPLVDRSLFDVVRKIPSSIRLAAGKQLLLDSVPEIPEWIASQPKRGFRFPFQSWVSGQWGQVFDQLKRQSPVPLDAWYQAWTLFTLESFLVRCGIESDGRLLEAGELADPNAAPGIGARQGVGGSVR